MSYLNTKTEPLLFLSVSGKKESLSTPFVKADLDRYFEVSRKWYYALQQQIKRVLDFSSALFLLILAAPLLVLIALFIKVTSKGPVFYRSVRIGRNQQAFLMYKFRTMVQNADKLRAELRDLNRQQKQLFKIERDPRITPGGAFLRKYSLDELPQLINVLLGHMSLVGPRPFEPDDSALFEAPYHIRFDVMPGITGLWQVCGRSLTSFEKLCELEVKYILRWNLLEDFLILLKTIPAVLRKQGAY